MITTKKFTLKEYSIEFAPVGTRFMLGGHSTVLIVTNTKENKSVVCVSESGMLRKLPFGTKIDGIKEAKDLFRSLSYTITNLLIQNHSRPKNGFKSTNKIKNT